MPEPDELIRLSDLQDGTLALLAEIRGGRHLTRRLLSLGLRQGSPLSVVQRRGRGLVLASGDARIAVGPGIADKLWVSLATTPAITANPDTRLSSCEDGLDQPPAGARQGL